ncbi:MAG TPA: Gfo/Idh/MocA family oxidoreductase [Candidatus Hydrogenedentes bacterium]|nr:Gfo/Idh/MocA family oxidoreductase [Candidatus Hydrogenedentota bacterium]HRT21301.1 Gfo/Idh/MocA family oxidoreductase [Candidatus Hydrogenedentota bacterium]HRT65498.1 Gfo/Idh/MocA family oxidoreductase [Candidatus Hydrogenedentota bacterium]
MMKKGTFSRRRFLAGTAAASAAFSLFPGRVLGANDRVNIGIIGLGGKGGAHLADFGKIPNVEILAVCDADKARMEKAGDKIAKHQDLRRLIEMKDIDAVVIATPDHWHCLAAIMAFQAGKHAYVEKPVSHCIWEGRKMVEAARKYNRIVQTGTQQRSCPAVQECAKDIQSGMYGKVLWAHCSKLDARDPIGKVDGPQPPPETVDYNLWAGPAPMAPIMRKEFHYDWHWQWDWGTGEMGNWGVHYLDDLRHLLGWDDVPGNAIAAGNRWWDDDGETPNMHMCLMEHRGTKIVIDIRNMKDPKKGGDQGAVYLKSRGGNYLMCENGYINIARGGGKAFDKDGKQIKQYKGTGGSGHDANFINAIREGSNKSLAAEIEIGHMSTVLCHQANIAFRVGKAASVEEVRESVKQHEDALNTLESMVEQLHGNAVDLKAKPFILGPKLTYDAKTETFTGDHAEEANAFVKRIYREPFVVPDNV